MASTTASEKKTARYVENVVDAEIALIGYTRSERDDWEAERNYRMADLADKGFAISCIARASGYVQSRVEAYVRAARERRQRS